MGGGGGVKTHQHYLSLWCDFFLVSSSIHFPFFRSRCSGNWIWIDEGLIMNFSARDFYISIASNSLPWSLYLQLTLYLAIANHLDLHLSDHHSVNWRDEGEEEKEFEYMQYTYQLFEDIETPTFFVCHSQNATQTWKFYVILNWRPKCVNIYCDYCDQFSICLLCKIEYESIKCSSFSILNLLSTVIIIRAYLYQLFLTHLYHDLHLRLLFLYPRWR